MLPQDDLYRARSPGRCPFPLRVFNPEYRQIADDYPLERSVNIRTRKSDLD